jgi:hypothetical protein
MSITHVRITAPQTAGEARGHIGTIALAPMPRTVRRWPALSAPQTKTP